MISAILACVMTVTINRSELKWTAHDTSVMKRAQLRCGQKFAKSPCLKKFVKIGYNEYLAICGRKKDG